MSFESGLDRFSKVCASLGDVAKSLLTLTAFAGVVIAVVQPQWIRSLANQFDFGTAAKFGGVLRSLNEPLFEALKALSDAQVATASATESNKLSTASSGLATAQEAVAQQAIQVLGLAERMGVPENIPTTGWIFVGYLMDGRILPVHTHVAAADLRPTLVEGKVAGISELTLRFDAEVTQASDCRYVRVDDEPTPSAPRTSTRLILSAASGKPVRVLALDSCKGRFGESVWAKIDVPRERVLIVSRTGA